jgi:hypothetical protein
MLQRKGRKGKPQGGSKSDICTCSFYFTYNKLEENTYDYASRAFSKDVDIIIDFTLLRTANHVLAGHGACWSDSDGPTSTFIKCDAESVVDFKKDGLLFFESVFKMRRSVVSLTCTAGNFCYILSCTYHLVNFTNK